MNGDPREKDRQLLERELTLLLVQGSRRLYKISVAYSLELNGISACTSKGGTFQEASTDAYTVKDWEILQLNDSRYYHYSRHC